MSAKKWLVAFVATAVLLALLLCGFNVLTDPFGVFGDPVMDWYSYDETMNPRAAKAVYLKSHFDDYDAYVLGCSSTSSFPTQALNEAYGASFYNMIVYGADMLDTEQTAKWLLENDDVRYILLNVYIDNGLSYNYESNPLNNSMLPDLDGSSKLKFYSRFAFASPEYGLAKLKARKSDTWLQQSFDVFDVPTGCYDKRKRDVEAIGPMDEYLQNYPIFTDYPDDSLSVPHTAECMESVARIREMCQAAGTELIVVTAPVYCDYLAHFSREAVESFYTALANVTPFRDFSRSSVSFEPRYFYDGTHFRNAVGEMAVAKMTGASGYIPADFGYAVTAENVGEYFETYWDAAPLSETELTARVPILMYHHLSDTEENSATISPARFKEHIAALEDAGYTAVGFDELKAFVYDGVPLPDKCVVITFDDGYQSNYDYAYPVLREHGMKATIFTIGSSVGKDTYKDTGEPMHPHFGAEAAREMVQSGTIDIGSHTYDMHQSAALEEGPARQNVAPLEGESEEDFIRAMREDFARSIAETEAMCGEPADVLAYPEGVHSDLTQAIAWEAGFRVTLTSDPGVNTLVKGLPQSLLGLNRFGMNESVSAAELLELLK